MRNRFFKVLGFLIVVALLFLPVILSNAGNENGAKKSELQIDSSSETNKSITWEFGVLPPPDPKEVEEMKKAIEQSKQHPIERPANFSDAPTIGINTEVISSNFTWGVVTNGLQYGISLEKDTYKVGEDILLTMVLTNMGIPSLVFETFRGGKASVLDENGSEVSYTKAFKEFSSQPGGHFSYVCIQRGMHWSDMPTNLAWIFDLSKPGNYSISVTRAVKFGEKFLRIPSGVIKFKIIEEKKKP